jgi:protein SCO1/2
MNDQTKARLKRTALLSLLALIVGSGVGYIQIQMAKAPSITGDAPMAVAGADIGGPFTLVDQNGKTVTEKNFGGQYKLIYFGFTYCPAICPTELQKISATLKNIEKNQPDLAAKIQPLFISVDPERDTPAVLKEYVSLYHPRLIGLTGSQAQIDAVKKDYRIYSAKVESENSTDYTVDHSSFIYFMGPDDTLLGIYRSTDDAEMITKDIRKQIVALDTP